MNQEDTSTIIQKAAGILQTEHKDEKAFDQLFRLLAQAFENKHYFCKIQGKRWAFLAGDDDMITPEKQLQLTRHYGILYDSPYDINAWHQVIEALKHYLELRH
mgnify:CR=1 FL=1